MRPAFHLEEMGIMGPKSRLQTVKRSLFLHLLRRDRSLRTLFTIDETLMDYVRRSEPELAGRLRYLPDPVELRGSHSRESARRMLRIPDNAITVLVYGMLTGRKGVDALLASMSEGGLHKKLCVLLAGVQDAGVKELLASPVAERCGRPGASTK